MSLLLRRYPVAFIFLFMFCYAQSALVAENSELNFTERVSGRPIARFKEAARHLAYATDLFSISLSGYIKSETIYDTYQVIGVHDDQVLLYPEPVRRDIFGKDINKRGQFDEYAFETRYAVDVKGPPANEVQTRLYIEGDFFGRLEIFPSSLERLTVSGNDVVNTFRMRHAFLEIAWPKVEFLAGQAWIPFMFPIESPGTISFNAGVPIDAFGRNPQVRVTYRETNFEIMGVALGSVDAFNDGPDGANTTYQRNSMMPEFNLELRIRTEDDRHYLGSVFGIRRIVPRLVTSQNIRTREQLTSLGVTVFSKLSIDPFTVYTKFIWGENLGPYYAMIGGYAVDSYNQTTDQRTYTPLRTLAAWLELVVNPIHSFEPAVFAGVVKNQGAGKTIITSLPEEEFPFSQTIFGLNPDIDYVLRVSPRIKYYRHPFVLAGEYEYTRAAFGTINNQGTVDNGVPSSNSRFLLALFYFF